MINQDFCEFLEYEICKAFKHTDNDQIKGFWCDGVLLNQSDSPYSQKSVNDNRQIILKAFIGKEQTFASCACFLINGNASSKQK